MFLAPSHGRVVPSALGTLPSIPTLRVVRLPDRREYATTMATLVTRNQFNVTPQGVVHKPTEAAFIPSPGDPLLGTMRLGQLKRDEFSLNRFGIERSRCRGGRGKLA